MANRKTKPASKKKSVRGRGAKPRTAESMSLTAMHPAGMIFTLTITPKPGNEAQIDLGIDAHPGVDPIVAKLHLDRWHAWARRGFVSGSIDDSIPEGWSWIYEHMAEPVPPDSAVH